MRHVLLGLLLLGVVGCERKQVTKEMVPLDKISAEVMDVATKTLPDVKFESARKIKINGEDAYEIRGKMPNGKIREAEVSVSGKVLEIE